MVLPCYLVGCSIRLCVSLFRGLAKVCLAWLSFAASQVAFSKKKLLLSDKKQVLFEIL